MHEWKLIIARAVGPNKTSQFDYWRYVILPNHDNGGNVYPATYINQSRVHSVECWYVLKIVTLFYSFNVHWKCTLMMRMLVLSQYCEQYNKN